MNSGSRHGFTLIEMALVTIVLGVLIMLLLPPMMQVITRGKITEGKNQLEAIKNDIVGYAMINKQLPSMVGNVGNPSDAWNNAYGYWRQGNITAGVGGAESSICNSVVTTTAMADSRNMVTNGGPVNGTAFLITSNGPNGVRDITATAVGDFDPNNPIDLTNHGDDLIDYVSVNQLKVFLGCGG